MRKGISPAAAAASLAAALVALAGGAALGQQEPLAGLAVAPQRVLPVGGLIDRMVHDGIGMPVAVIRDVVIVRDTGETLAVLEVLQRPGEAPGAPAPSHVVAPLPFLRLPADGTVRLVASAPALAELPPIALPPLAVARGLMVPAPDAGPLRVLMPSAPVPPQVAADPR